MNYTDYNSFSDLFSDLLAIQKRICHFNVKLGIFLGIMQVSRFEFLELTVGEILNLPMYMLGQVLSIASQINSILVFRPQCEKPVLGGL